MTILHDECKPVTDNPKTSDAVVKLMAEAAAEYRARRSAQSNPYEYFPPKRRNVELRIPEMEAILSALSDKGLAVVSVEKLKREQAAHERAWANSTGRNKTHHASVAHALKQTIAAAFP